MVKSYPTQQFPSHEGVTKHLGRDIEVNDRVIFSDPWGTIEFKGTGVFIAGGAGITPFIAILRKLEQDGQLEGNRLFFSNKAREDVFLQGELFRMMGRAAVCTLTQEKHRDYEHGRIDKDWLQSRVDDYSQPFYVCGPPSMVDDLKSALKDLGAEVNSIVFEE
ncbi:Benzoate 1,2-dioxygenase electron transfer component [Stieleria maiorica]|uniref:Benzoate 1,2-dioxygenase electron transfer component n=1 Tax=Stieleria maiorica TaxID=2795974 RepID=A0A5B9MGS4_9BACT|nr:flavodoxin reductase [Stieleria maiorica]QEG00483.1 Benzoate 1,2-dioxygenase electron transfer component [Stieleria maiorica]